MAKTAQPAFTFDKSARYQVFREKLRAAGVHVETLWQARKDGQGIDCMRNRYPDVECIAFRGKAAIWTAIVTLYTNEQSPADAGFGLFFPATGNMIDDDVKAILGAE